MVIDTDLMWSAGFWAQHLTYDYRHAEWGEIKELAAAEGISVRDDIEDRIGGENIAGGVFAEEDPVATDMRKFLASEGHRNTILDADWTRVGIGFAVAEDGRHIYCTQHFGR